MIRAILLLVLSFSLYPSATAVEEVTSFGVGAIVGIALGSVILLVLTAFGCFICCLRSKLPDGVPKPPVCTTIKVGCGMITAKCCPCCKSCQYSAIP